MEASDKKTQKKEENEKREKEVEDKIKSLDISFTDLKIKKLDLKQNFLTHIKAVLSINTKKIKNEKLQDDIYLLIAKMIETALAEKELVNFHESLSQDEKCELNKFFYQTYERTCVKKNCLTLKPAKIYSMQSSLITSVGAGLVSRSLFSIQK
jgi:hypothetical protein